MFATENGKRFERVLLRDRNRYAGAAALFEFRVLPGNVGYAALNSFNDEQIVREFETAYEQIEKTGALILDLRANPGGSEGNGRRILAYFFDRPFQTSIRGTRRNRASYRAQGQAMDWHVWPQQMLQPHGKKFLSKPIVVLTSARTGSAAEDFLVSLEIERRAVIVGEPTGGSAGQPLFISLPGGGSGGICTSASWYPDGRTFVGTGIQPNIRVRPAVADVRSGRDAALEAALKHLGEAGTRPGRPGGSPRRPRTTLLPSQPQAELDLARSSHPQMPRIALSP